MPGIVALVNLISNDVVAKMAAAGLPPLTDGQIVLGKSKRFDNSFAPRVIFIPLGSRFEPRSTPVYSSPINPKNPLAPGSGVRSYTMTTEGSGYSATPTVTVSAPDVAGSIQATAVAIVRSGAIAKVVAANTGSGYLSVPTVTITDSTGAGAAATANLAPQPQALSVISQRAILTEVVQFEVHCWGVSSTGGAITPDTNFDFDATQVLYQQVISSAKLLAPGVVEVSSLRWFDAMESATITDVVGHDVKFLLEIQTPLTDAPLAFAPVGVQPNPTNFLIPFSGGTPEQGSSG